MMILTVDFKIQREFVSSPEVVSEARVRSLVLQLRVRYVYVTHLVKTETEYKYFVLVYEGSKRTYKSFTHYPKKLTRSFFDLTVRSG